MTTENPFDGREYDGRVFRDRHERNFFIGRLSPRQREEWLRDHPERWQTRRDFLRDLQARAGTDVEAEPPESRSTKSINEVLTSGGSDGPLPVPGEDKRLPDKSATNTTPPPIGNAESKSATAVRRDHYRRAATSSASVALPQCWATASGSYNVGAENGKVLRARRSVAGSFMKSTSCRNG